MGIDEVVSGSESCFCSVGKGIETACSMGFQTAWFAGSETLCSVGCETVQCRN